MKKDLIKNNNNSLKRVGIVNRNCIYLLFLFFITTSCEKRKELIDKELYEGPISTIYNFNTLFSDSAKIKFMIRAQKQENFENGDSQWSEGLLLEALNENGEIEFTLSSNQVHYSKEEKVYRATGNVEVKNLETKEQLNSEELIWEPSKEEFKTDKFVTIKSEDEVHTGEGMIAKQDFSSYEILKPTGTFNFENSASDSLSTSDNDREDKVQFNPSFE